MIRPLDWPADRPRLMALDTSFHTAMIYRVVNDGYTFKLEAERVSPPLYKDYGFSHDVDELPSFAHVTIAEVDDTLAGVAALKWEAWNRRAVLWHCYVAPSVRGRGVGRALIDDMKAHARQLDARCLWLETQNVNYPAVKFYERMGFRWCGLDTTLYDAGEQPSAEVALFFTLPCRSGAEEA